MLRPPDRQRPNPAAEVVRFREALPSVIDAPYPFVAIGDLNEVGKALLGGRFTAEEAARFETELEQIQRRHAPAESTFFGVEAARLSAALERIVRDEASHPDNRTGIVYLDKYLGCGADIPPHFRLELSRGSNDTLMPRVGCRTSVDEQLADLAAWTLRNKYEELLLTDDVLAFGSTVPVIAGALSERIPQVTLRLLTGIAASGGIWRGVENVQKIGIEPEYLTRVMASEPIEGRTKGMALPVSRDFTLFGGRGGEDPTGIQLSHPYFLPFSKPLLSLIDRQNVLSAAEELLEFNDSLVAHIESGLGRRLLFSDISAAGYGIPYTALESVKPLLALPAPGDSVRDMIARSHEMLGSQTAAILEAID